MDASPRTSLAHRLVLPKPPPKRQKKRTCRRRHDAGHKPKRRGNIRGNLKLRFGIWTTEQIPINILKHRTPGGIWMSRCPEKVGLMICFMGGWAWNTVLSPAKTKISYWKKGASENANLWSLAYGNSIHWRWNMCGQFEPKGGYSVGKFS